MTDMTDLNWTSCMAAVANDFGKFVDYMVCHLPG